MRNVVSVTEMIRTETMNAIVGIVTEIEAENVAVEISMTTGEDVIETIHGVQTGPIDPIAEKDRIQSEVCTRHGSKMNQKHHTLRRVQPHRLGMMTMRSRWNDPHGIFQRQQKTGIINDPNGRCVAIRVAFIAWKKPLKWKTTHQDQRQPIDSMHGRMIGSVREQHHTQVSSHWFESRYIFATFH